jgi:hypothetical protein
VPHPLRRCLREYLCRRLLRRLSHSAFSMMDVTDVSARAGIVSASGSTIAAVSTITGVGSRRRGLVTTQPMILGFVVPTTESSSQTPQPFVRPSELTRTPYGLGALLSDDTGRMSRTTDQKFDAAR